MYNILLAFALLTTASFVHSVALADASFGRKLTLPAIRMSRDELFDLIGKADSLAETANSRTPNLSIDRTFSLSKGDESLSVRGNFTRQSIKRGPKVATSVRYEMSVRGEGAISRFSFFLADGLREVEISGADANQVDSLAATLEADFQRHTTWLGGPMTRFYLGALLIIFSVGIPFLAAKLQIKFKNSLRMNTFIAIVMTAPQLLLYLPPWSDLIPGTAIFSSDASFAVREAPQIGLIGTLVGILGLIVSVWFGMRGQAGNTQRESPKILQAQDKTESP